MLPGTRLPKHVLDKNRPRHRPDSHPLGLDPKKHGGSIFLIPELLELEDPGLPKRTELHLDRYPVDGQVVAGVRSPADSEAALLQPELDQPLSDCSLCG